MGDRKKLCDIVAELEHETEKAYLINDGGVKVWVPKSVVEYDEDTNTFTMPEYFAKDKGLI
jgi:hypothetical protein